MVVTCYFALGLKHANFRLIIFVSQIEIIKLIIFDSQSEIISARLKRQNAGIVSLLATMNAVTMRAGNPD